MIEIGADEIALQPGDTLVVRLVVPDSLSDSDVHIAFDTATYPAHFAVH